MHPSVARHCLVTVCHGYQSRRASKAQQTLSATWQNFRRTEIMIVVIISLAIDSRVCSAADHREEVLAV